jgi:hypothetical protein
VRLLSQVSESKDKHDEILQSISKALHTALQDIMRTAIQVMGEPTALKLDHLERELEIVVEKAIGYSLVLRRQRAWVCLIMPEHEMTAVGHVQSERDLLSFSSQSRSRSTSQAMAQTCIFIRPQVIRFTTVTGEELPEHFVVVQEAEEHRLLVFLNKTTRAEASPQRRSTS